MSWNTHIPKFRRFVLQNFPFIEEDFDALTDYALICKVIEYLNTVINSQNEVVAEVERFETDITNNFNRLEGLFNDLKSYVDNYFDNLDVQEEINNKLDQMAEDGTLQEIITAYIQSNVAWTFDTVADMKLATNLVDGSYAQTLGFYSANDGGGCIYKISESGTANEMDVIAVGSLYANLIRPELINPIMLGAKGDGTTDDTLSLQQTILYAKSNSIDAIDGLNKQYLVSDVVDLPSSMSTVGEKGLYVDYGVIIKNFHFTLKDDCAALTSVLNIQIPVGKQTILDNIEIDGNCNNQSTTEGAQDGGLHGIRVGKKNIANGAIIIRNSYVHDCFSDCIVIREATYDYVNVDNCRIIGAGRNGITDNAKNSLIENTIFTDNGYRTAPRSGYHIEADDSFDFGKKTIKNCIINYTGDVVTQNRGGINIYFNAFDFTFDEFNVIDCEIDKLNINSSNNGNINYFNRLSLKNSKFGKKYHWIGKTESLSKLEFKEINIDNCLFERYLVIQGSTGTNKPDVNINQTEFTGSDTTVELYFGMNNVVITNCKFSIDSPLVSDGANCNCINSNFTDNSTVYTINNLVVENCISHNYWRLLDNHTYSTGRTGKTIGTVKLLNNIYETTGGGKFFYNWNGGNITKCIIDGNMLSSTTSTSKKFEPGTCSYFIGVNNICDFASAQGFDVTGATKSIVDNNLFSDS